MTTLTWYTLAAIISAIAVCIQSLIFYKQWQLQHQLNDWQAREVLQGQARKVSIWRESEVDSDFIIHNASDSPIYKVVVSCSEDEDAQYTRLVGILPPGQYEVAYDRHNPAMHHAYYPVIWFQDYNNQCWKRRADGTLEKCKDYLDSGLVKLPQEPLVKKRMRQ